MKEDEAIKLLIVDDENLTRTGLRSAVDWMSLGIDEVYLSADGEDGCRQALLHEPDIILSDVRMPRMTGIEMLDRVRKIRPDTVFIFMSGYSDKEYLKAAIRLQAVSYVEKPLDIGEVSAAVREAVERCRRIEAGHRAESVSDTVSASHLALALTMPYSVSKKSVLELSRNYCRKYGSADLFRSAFTIILQMDERDELSPDFLNDTSRLFHDRIRSLHMHMVAAERKTNLFVFHIFRKESFTDRTTLTAANMLADSLPSVRNWYITAGTVVSGFQNLYDSYSSAVILLQQTFFFPPQTIMSVKSEESLSDERNNYRTLCEKLRQALRNPDRKEIRNLENELYDSLVGSRAVMRQTVLASYYQIATDILEERKKRHLPGAGVPEQSDSTLDALNRCFSFPELHETLTKITQQYLTDIENYVPERSSIYLIKDYIHRHYSDPMLSTREISQAAALSTSYACTVFKNETGQTVNQYLTEYRLERAQELLDDPRNTISEVAAMTGYNDANYFGKAFKKYTGHSPSEYRELR